MASTATNTISKKFKSFLLLWNRPLWAMIIAFVVYFGFALNNGLGSSPYNYFAYLADAFLHGQFHLRFIPPITHDLVFFENQLFLYWLPMPGILLMPLVAIFGTALSDVLVTVIISVINVAIFCILIQKSREKEIHQLDPLKSAIMVLFFAFGTVHLTLSPYGKVWQLSQEICLSFMLLTYLFAISLNGWKAFLFTSMALTGAVLTRSNVVFVGIWPIYFLLYTHWKLGYKKIIKLVSIISIPLILGLIFLLFYNYTRFQNPFEMGLQYHQMASFFANDYEKYGLFNIHYLKTNLYYYFVYYPLPARTSEWMMGGSLFLLSPVFFSIFFSFHDHSRKRSIIFLWLTIFLTCIPLLLLMGTGWVTFGPRYTLDFAVPLLLLTAIGLEKWSWKILLLLTLNSCLHYFVGTILLGLI